jgi:pimeloyl-ACP methyl ester carboxylesterase
VVLVGHSYAGIVVTAAADRVTDRVAHLVYIDCGPLPDGVAQAEFAPPEERERNAALVTEHGDGWRLPPPPWAELAAGVANVDETTVALLDEWSVPQPWATAVAPVRLSGAWEKVPRFGVLSTFGVDQVRAMAAAMPMARHMASGSWRFEELPTWHWPMLSRPGELAVLLDRVVDDTGHPTPVTSSA